MSSSALPDPAPKEEPPDLPGLRTWAGVYWFVFLWFVIVVILLAIFTRVFS